MSAAALPSVQDIVQRAVANDEQRHEHRLSMECDQLPTTQHLDAQEAVTKTKTVRVDLAADEDADHQDAKQKVVYGWRQA